MNKQTLIIATIVIGFMALGAGVGIYAARQQQASVPPQINGLLWPPKQLHGFTTTADNGRAFGLPELQGKWSFLFFGFTNCPDVCPITLSVLNEVYAKLQNREETQVLFISVDPERDSPEQLAAYVDYFNEDFTGLGGTLAQVESLTKQMGIMHFRGEKSESGDYLVDHTASIFLLDPAGRMVGVFSMPHEVGDISEKFENIREFIGQQERTSFFKRG